MQEGCSVVECIFRTLCLPRASLVWDFTERRLEICCRRFETDYRSHLQRQALKILEDGTTAEA
jgi:hypothetical protein